MADKPQSAHALAVGTYRYGVDDFSEWVEKFEGAVGLAHGVEPGDKKNELCLKWLILKLDETSTSTYKSCTKATWPEIKVELAKLLIDPQEKYDIFAGRNPIKWDGKESFRQLATRIRRRIDRHDLGRDPQREYFAAFRLALPYEYSRQIDVALGDEWNLEKAIEIAGRIHLADRNAATEGDSKAVAFTGASMSDDRIKALEMSNQGVDVKIDNLVTGMENLTKENRRMRDDIRELRESRPREDRSRDRDRRESRPRENRRDESRGRRSDRRDSSDNRRREESRRRDESRRSRESRDRYRGYGDNRRQDSYDRRDRDRRDDSYNRGRSRDYRDDRRRSSDRSRDRDYNRSRDRDYDRGRGRSEDRNRNRSRERSYDRGENRDRGRTEDRRSGPNSNRRDSLEVYRNRDGYRGSREQSDAPRGTNGRDAISTIANLDLDALAAAIRLLDTRGSGN